MGLFNLFKKEKHVSFRPNPKKTEYENWLDFLDCGGTSKEWERMKKENNWSFRESKEEKYVRYQKEIDASASRYYDLLSKIEKDWSVLYNSKEYNGPLAYQFEQDCLTNIECYKAMRAIDKKHGEKTATNIPAFKRLAMLYEKQGKFEDAITVCMQAFKFGMDERSRMTRMIKKVGRTPTAAELKILNKD